MSIRILIIGNTSDNHLKRFHSYINKIDSEKKIDIEVFNINHIERYNLFNKTYHIKNYFPHFLFKIRYLNGILTRINYYLSFFMTDRYDLINIHYLTMHSYILLPLYKIKSKKIMISPWGSDVYRIKNDKVRKRFQKVYKTADYVSIPLGIKFSEDVQRIFSIPKPKLVDLGFGSETIDVLINNEHITKKRAKINLNIENSFIITCGYNRNKVHNHLAIIDALIKVKKVLPDNTLLFFPMTYGPVDNKYLDILKEKLSESAFQFKIFEEFMPSERLVLIEKACDLFVHIQNTDANSATLQEYLFCGTDIINGEWLKYPQFEKYGVPYIQVQSVDALCEVLMHYFTSRKNISVPVKLKEDIRKNAWSNKIKEWYNFYVSLQTKKQ